MLDVKLLFNSTYSGFEFWVLRFRDLGASFSSFGCFVLRSSFSKLPSVRLATDMMFSSAGL